MTDQPPPVDNWKSEAEDPKFKTARFGSVARGAMENLFYIGALGAVLLGILSFSQPLVNNFSASAAAQNMLELSTAVTVYRDRFAMLPGDDSTAYFRSGKGYRIANGNNHLDGAYNSNYEGDETVQMWHDLEGAGLADAGSGPGVAGFLNKINEEVKRQTVERMKTASDKDKAEGLGTVSGFERKGADGAKKHVQPSNPFNGIYGFEEDPIATDGFNGQLFGVAVCANNIPAGAVKTLAARLAEGRPDDVGRVRAVPMTGSPPFGGADTKGALGKPIDQIDKEAAAGSATRYVVCAIPVR